MMKNERSIGVAIIGWFFVVYGFLGFLGSLLFNQLLWNNFLSAKWTNLAFRAYPNIRILGLTGSELTGYFRSLFEKLFMEYPALWMFHIFLIPLSLFIIALGGIGILRLKNEWRNATIGVFIILMLAKFIIGIYFKSYIFMTIIKGKLINPSNKEVAFGIEKILLLFSRSIVQDLFATILLISIVIFYLTRPKVKERFKCFLMM